MSWNRPTEGSRLVFVLNRLRERLWVKPLMFGMLSAGAVFMADLAAYLPMVERLPDISNDSIETLLKIISASMLVIAMFAVGAMLSAYASASNTATPRSFSVVVADDVSQNALSTFIGAFIFSLVALVAVTNGYFDHPGRFAIFVLTLLVFAVVILGFVRWVDRIARLGRLGSTVDKLEAVTQRALLARRRQPTLGARNARDKPGGGTAVLGNTVGYVQCIDLDALQSVAEAHDLLIHVSTLPGSFAWPDRPLAYVMSHKELQPAVLRECVNDAFTVGDNRTFDEDPRFGLVVLSEIASRALSPAVNDPGTAIDVIGTLTRLFSRWVREQAGAEADTLRFDRLFVRELSMDDCFDDAFHATARDGAGTLEVVIHLQKALRSLAWLDVSLKPAALRHGHLVCRYAEKALTLEEESQALQRVTTWLHTDGPSSPPPSHPAP